MQTNMLRRRRASPERHSLSAEASFKQSLTVLLKLNLHPVRGHLFPRKDVAGSYSSGCLIGPLGYRLQPPPLLLVAHIALYLLSSQ
jgi:hypothetical protein